MTLATTSGFSEIARNPTVIERIARRLNCRTDTRALLELDDNRLRDIGLTRGQVHAAADGIAPLPTGDAGAAPATARSSGRRRLPLTGVLLCISMFLALPAAAADAAADALPTVADLPAGTVKVSPPVPGMGEHWANPKDLPLGPIYCVMGGKVICAEFMVVQEAFIKGKSFERLHLGMTGKLPPVDHLEMTFMPDGHEGFAVPHYDVHMYFVPPEARFPERAER